jgi:hypothetical protein
LQAIQLIVEDKFTIASQVVKNYLCVLSQTLTIIPFLMSVKKGMITVPLI